MDKRSKFVRDELAAAVALHNDYAAALACDEGAEPPLALALDAIEHAADGVHVSPDVLGRAVRLCESLRLLEDGTHARLDVREPRTALEELVAAACAYRRLEEGRPVAAQHLALLGGVGPSAVRMAIKDGPLERATKRAAGADEADKRVYVTAASARDWVAQRR